MSGVRLATTCCWCKPVTLDADDRCTTCGKQWHWERPARRVAVSKPEGGR